MGIKITLSSAAMDQANGYVVRLAASETESGQAKHIAAGQGGRSDPSAPKVTDVAKAARMGHAEARGLAAQMAQVSGGYGWTAVRADVAAAGYEVEGLGTGLGYRLLLSGAELSGPHPTREAAWAAAVAHIAA